MKLKKFNSGKSHFKKVLKENREKIAIYGTLATSVLVLVIGIIFLSYAKYTMNQDSSAYNLSTGDFYEGQYKIAAYLNGTKQDSIPSRTYEEGGVTKTAYVRNIQCTDGATGRWDTELWNLTVSGSTKTGTKCEIYFDNDGTLADNSTYATKYNPFPIGYVFLSTEDNYASTLISTFGGTWVKIDDGNYLRTGGGSGGNDISTLSVTGTALTVNQIPSHTHSRGSMNITGWYNTPYMIVKSSSGTTYNSITLWPGGAFYTSKSTTTRPIITTSDSWSEISTTAFDASRSWTGVSSATGGGQAHTHQLTVSANGSSSNVNSVEINKPKYVGIYAYKRTA